MNLKRLHNDLHEGALQLIAEHRVPLLARARSLCGNSNDADELVIRTIDQAIRKIDTYTGEGDILSWMMTILVNLHNHDYRSPVVRNTLAVEADELEKCAGADWATDEQILKNSDSEAIRQAIAELDPKYNQVLMMRYYEEFSLKQIADILRLPLGTVCRRAQIAHRLLAGKLSGKLGKAKKPLTVAVALLLLGGSLFGAWKAGLGEWLSDFVNSQETQQEQTERNEEMNAKTIGKVASVAISSMALATEPARAAMPDDYVREGLIAHWDGIANAGKDKPHDSAATTWVDLVGGRAFALTGVTVNDDRLTFSGSASSYGQLSASDTAATFDVVGECGTVEIVLKADGTANAIAFQSPTTLLCKYSNLTVVYSGVSPGKPRLNWCWDKVHTNTVSLSYVSAEVESAFANGEPIAQHNTVDYYGTSGSSAFIGTRQSKANSHFNGSIYAIRLYNRKLSASEVALNAALDVERFQRGNTTPNVFATAVAETSVSGETVPLTTEGFYPPLDAKAIVPASGTMTLSAPAGEFDVGAARKGTVTGGTLYEIDGGETNQVATTDTVILEYESKGLPLHMVWTVAYADGVAGATDFYADAENGDDSYEGADIGSKEHPFKTLEAAHAFAANYIATTSAKALIWLSEGRFDQPNQLILAAGESIVGLGMDRTFINAKDCTTITGSGACYLKVGNSDNLLASLCVTGLTGGASSTIRVEKGLVDHCRCAYNIGSTADCYGRGFYITGGTVQFCESDHNEGAGMRTRGAGAYVAGGTLTDSYIHDNNGTSERESQGHGVRITSGAVRRCRIYHNGHNTAANFSNAQGGGGVHVSGGGIIENSIVWDNRSRTSSYAGGVHNAGGTVRYCTIYGNTTLNDTTGISGFGQSSGTALNNIIFANAMPGAVVSGGICLTNLLDAAISGYALNFEAADVGFVDGANGDFHIASAASPAVGKALALGAVTTDFEGTARDPANPTIGAYEYVSAGEEFGANIRVLKLEWREGSAPSVELVVTGAPDESKLSIAWFLDGVEVPAAVNLKAPTFEGVALGRHTVKAVASYNGETKTDEKADAFVVKPLKVYVNTTGSGTFPFATFETGTNSLNAALEALWKDDEMTTTVDIDEGIYRLSDVVTLQYPIEVVGKGTEKTHLCGFDAGLRLVTLNNAGARMCGVTLTNAVSAGGLAIKSGLVDGCRIIRCNSTEYGGRGAGVNISGGTLQNSEVIDCTMSRDTAGGGGVAVVGAGALVSNCTIRACVCDDSRAIGGGGVVGFTGTMTHCRILDCRENINKGAAVLSFASDFTMRNCLVVGNTGSADSVVRIAAGTMESCTVAGNTMPTGTAAVDCGGTVRNCVVWNGCTDITVSGGSVSYSCYSNATEGENGNTAENPKFRGGKNRGQGVISSRGSCFRAGVVLDWMTGATDILGNPRLINGEVDMGCYQVGFDPGLLLFIR